MKWLGRERGEGEGQVWGTMKVAIPVDGYGGGRKLHSK